MPDLRNIPVRFVGTRARRELMSGKVFMFSRVYGGFIFPKLNKSLKRNGLLMLSFGFGL